MIVYPLWTFLPLMLSYFNVLLNLELCNHRKFPFWELWEYIGWCIITPPLGTMSSCRNYNFFVLTCCLVINNHTRKESAIQIGEFFNIVYLLLVSASYQFLPLSLTFDKFDVSGSSSCVLPWL